MMFQNVDWGWRGGDPMVDVQLLIEETPPWGWGCSANLLTSIGLWKVCASPNIFFTAREGGRSRKVDLKIRAAEVVRFCFCFQETHPSQACRAKTKIKVLSQVGSSQTKSCVHFVNTSRNTLHGPFLLVLTSRYSASFFKKRPRRWTLLRQSLSLGLYQFSKWQISEFSDYFQRTKICEC